MSVHLGKVLDPYTKLYLQLCGENEESTKIVLRPSGTATDTFQEGKTYKFSVEMPDIGKVCESKCNLLIIYLKNITDNFISRRTWCVMRRAVPECMVL